MTSTARRTIPLPGVSRRGVNPETLLMVAIHDAVIASGRAVLWRNNGGVARFGEARVRYGLAPGSADLIGVVVRPGTPHHGRALAIEVKTPGEKLEGAQECWRGVWERAGGLYVCAHSVDEALRPLLELA